MAWFKKDVRLNVYVSLLPKKAGGGANTFAYNFVHWLKKNRQHYRYVRDIRKADKAIIIAHKADVDRVAYAKNKGCFIIHRLDEYFNDNEDHYRRQKHAQIVELNKYADVTVYQSQFVCHNVHPHLKNPSYTVIINGADSHHFCPAPKPGGFIGNVSWSIDERKHYDLLYDLIQTYPDEKFLLVGNHHKTQYAFRNFKNVTMIGAVQRGQMVKYYHKMKLLYLPSEKDPCPNTAVESVLCGVPVCYNADAGTSEIVKDCGGSLDDFPVILDKVEIFRQRCFKREDLHFDNVARQYIALCEKHQ